MAKFKSLLKKSWVFFAAAAVIISSNSIMAFALTNDVPAVVSENTATFTPAESQVIQTEITKANIKENTPAKYTVVDLSKTASDSENIKVIKEKLSKTKGITPEQIEEKTNAIIANMIPGEKDFSAEQASAYAASILKKAYEIDLTGYTAQASFSRSSAPNSDSWTVIFHAAKETPDTRRYLVTVDSVDGTMLNACFYTFNYTVVDKNENLEDPKWENTAIHDIIKLLPENVSVTDSKVVSSTPQAGVMVVCNLSNGAACAVRITGESKEAVAYQYFPNGYDGSWDYRPISSNAVG